ncbi:hypothetical protein EG856_01395 [Mycoplasmopsis phocirhinis]|uniref:Tail specific protease domain-containing protein n=1 Tax=Mycoplasmopsis phocirhinis TaxID=142650 RepID=A0A4P6MTC0_9BACT|nr:S41 family peptidase [Mycoplasmopsis phocirhinis]QBF34577.1 hypothetical protein EG856_01395 [Mycoplasmopsis phocirhinis]
MKFKLKSKFIPLITAVTLPTISLTSCFSSSDKKIYVTEQIPNELTLLANVNFNNLSREYLIKNQNINIFENKTNKNIYINVNEIFKKLNGFFDLKKLSKIDVVDAKAIIQKNNGDVVEFSTTDDKLVFTDSQAFDLSKSSLTHNYNQYLHFLDTTFKSLRSKDELLPTLNLKKYDMPIYTQDKNIYMPLSLFNLLFMSQNYYNLQYNGTSLLGYDYENSHSFAHPKYVKFYRDANWTSTSEQRLNNYNFLALLFDNFYGLSNELYKRHNSSDFNEFTHITGLYDKIIDQNYSTYSNAYEQLWYVYLNELHSRIITEGYLAPTNDNVNKSDSRQLSSKYADYEKTLTKLQDLRALEKQKNSAVIEGNIARIKLDAFLSGSKEEINSKQPYLYDSYELMKAAIAKIKRLDPQNKVKSIVIDISQNGGGSSAALEKVVGFLTKKPFNVFIQDRITKAYVDLKIGVDTNSDNKYNNKDGYDEYNWYLLTGINTFSAANLFAHVVKQTGIAKIIGQKSGGGMFAVLPTVLPDGTNVDISGPIAYSAASDNVNTVEDLPISEFGVEPDYLYPYDDFYDLEKLSKFINGIENIN